ncbi:MAG TPA: SURF1 family protein [Egibacteraceae bacterium]|nr:SURF1 family protein [Egibacteraceae bacterium]
MARFWLTPRWLISHVLVALLAGLFVSLGIWQLNRLDERRAHNAMVAERMGGAAQPLDEALAQGDGDELDYRRVTVTGEFLHAEEVLLGPLSRDGEPGYHVLTPLATADGRGVLIDRGWVPYRYDEPPVADAAPPMAQVTVSGIARRSQQQESFGPRIPAEGRLSSIARVDVSRLQRQASLDLAPVYIQLGTQEPSQSGPLPLPPALPELTEGNHLSYAVQWFLFAAIGVIGYGALLRGGAREHRGGLGDGVQDPAFAVTARSER